MHADLAALAERLGAPVDLSLLPTWKSQSRGHRDQGAEAYYDPDTRKAVSAKFDFDFKNFGYQP